MARTAKVARKTRETDITVEINLDGKGDSAIVTGVGFFDHMLTLLATHSRCDLKVNAVGDTHVDFHHTVEDTGIVLGKAISQALGDKCGIERAASEITIMEDSVVDVAIDIGGRSSLIFDSKTAGQVGNFDYELIKVFFDGLTKNMLANVYISERIADNRHHTAEAIFKGFARVFKRAISITGDRVPSSKGVIS